MRFTAEAILNGLLLALLPVMLVIRALLKRQRKYQVRSIWTGAPIITMPNNAKAERLLGFDTRTIVRSTYFITDKFDLNIIAKARNNRLIALLMTYFIFVWICLTADRVHAYTDGGILNSNRRFCFSSLELFFYKILKLKLFIWTYGGDVRTRRITRSLGEPNCCTDCIAIKSSCICDETDAVKNYKQVAKVAKAIFSMGDMIEYAPNSIADLFFWPIDLACNHGEQYKPSYPQFSKDRPLRVVHAPNHRQFKGTQYLEKAVAELAAEGIPIELILVEHVANEQALTIYRSADLIFDQCLIGFHGYFAIEAMALGKPVLCFIRHPDKYLLSPEQCPLVNINLNNLKSTLYRLATSERALLSEIGRQSRQYIEKHYSISAFANRLQKCYQLLGVSV